MFFDMPLISSVAVSCYLRRLLLLAWWVVLCAALVPDVHAAGTRSTEDDLASDFSDYVPVFTREDAYDDEAYMYFGKSFIVSLGSGLQVWTGLFGRLFKTAFPTFDFRLTSLSDRSAWEFGFSTATHSVSPELHILDFDEETTKPYADFLVGTNLRTFLYYIQWKYYFAGNVDALQRDSGIVSPCPFIGIGLSFLENNFDFRRYDQVVHWKFPMPIKLPIVGEIPVPIPSLVAGMDFALKPRSSTLSIEGRWIPYGSLLDIFTGGAAQKGMDTLFHERRLGDLQSLTARISFIF